MTRKEFKEHDWKAGEYVYIVQNNEYGAITIPHKVIRAKVFDVQNDSYRPSEINVYVGTKMHFYRYSSTRRGYGCIDIFLTRKDAVKGLEKRQNEFITRHRDRVKQALVNMRYDVMKQAWREWAKINSILRMNIMNK